MALLPLIERELRVALRKKRPVQSRLRVAALCAAGAVLFVFILSATNKPNEARLFHQVLFFFAIYFVARTPRLTAGTLADERRNETLGLLFLSGLSSGEVFVSKTLSAAAVAFTDMLAIVPMLALPFFMGGVSFELFLATVCCLPNLLFFALSVSLLASALTKDDGAAHTLAWAVLALLCVLPPTLGWAHQYFSGAVTMPEWLLLSSPGYGPYLVFKGTASAWRPNFWMNFFATLLWSASSLAVGAFALKRLWRDRDEPQFEKGWLKPWQKLFRGDAARRRRLAATWLDVNPFVWLSARASQPLVLAWLLIAGVLSGWLIAWLLWQRWPSVPNFFVTATVLILATRWIIHFSVAKAVGEGRHNGDYELLLTTPLNPSDIVWGELEALRVQFWPIVRALLAIEVIMIVAGLVMRSWTPQAVVVYACVWAFLVVWTWRLTGSPQSTLLTMWVSLNCGRAAHSVWRSSGINSWAWIWVFFNLRRGIKGLTNFPSGSLGEIVLVLVCFLVLLLVLKEQRDKLPALELRLISEFREIIREPVPDPDDKRFKRWNIRERFPWGWEVVQGQLRERLARQQTRGLR